MDFAAGCLVGFFCGLLCGVPLGLLRRRPPPAHPHDALLEQAVQNLDDFDRRHGFLPPRGGGGGA